MINILDMSQYNLRQRKRINYNEQPLSNSQYEQMNQ